MYESQVREFGIFAALLLLPVLASLGHFFPFEGVLRWSIIIGGAGLAFGVPAGVVYHVLLYRALRRAEVRVSARWLLHPTRYHESIEPQDRPSVLIACYLGAIGFAVSMTASLVVFSAMLGRL